MAGIPSLQLLAEYSSWDDFFCATKEYCDRTYQPFVKTSCKRVMTHNKSNTKQLPEEMVFTYQTLGCTHRGDFHPRGKGLRETKSSKEGCRAKIHAALRKDNPKIIVVTSLIDIHNHDIGPHLYKQYSQNRALTASERAEAEKLCSLDVPNKKLRKELQAVTGKSVTLQDVINVKKAYRRKRKHSDMADIGWGMLQDCEGYGTLGDMASDHQTISKEEVQIYPEYKHAAHGMIFARQNKRLWDLYESRAMVMMQMRFDGVLGFPGGLVDAGENPVEGLNREMAEEIGLDLNTTKFDDSHYVMTQVNQGKKLLLNFYLMEVTPEVFSTLERNCLHAPEYGIETLGSIRVPLYTMGDDVRGFPAFLANQFAGNSRDQLISGLLAAKILSSEEIMKAVAASQNLLEGKKF